MVERIKKHMKEKMDSPLRKRRIKFGLEDPLRAKDRRPSPRALPGSYQQAQTALKVKEVDLEVHSAASGRQSAKKTESRHVARFRSEAQSQLRIPQIKGAAGPSSGHNLHILGGGSDL